MKKRTGLFMKGCLLSILSFVYMAFLSESWVGWSQAVPKEDNPATAVVSIPFEDSPFGISDPGGRPQIGWEDHITLLTDMNVHWVGAQAAKGGLSWGRIQASKDAPYDWNSSDNTVRRLQAKDINFFSILYPVATWDLLSKYSRSEIKFRPNGLPVPRLPVNLTAYGRFVEAAVERYDGDGKEDMPGIRFPIKYWMTIAEPDNPGDWNDTPENYAVLIKTMYDAIKKANSDAKLVIHGSEGAIGGGVKAYKEGGFMDRVFRKLKETVPEEKYKDFIWGFHYTTPVSTYHRSEDLMKSMNRLTKDFGYGLFPTWVTETGTFSGSIAPGRRMRLSLSQTESQQAGELVKRFIFNMARGVKKVFWVRLVDSSFEMGPFKSVGLLTLDGGKKLSYYTYKKMVEILEGSDWNDIRTVQEGDGIYIYEFMKNNKTIWVAWNDNSQEIQITIPKIKSSQVKITKAIPKYELGKKVPDYNTAFEVETKQVNNGMITIPLKESSVFVEEK